MKFKLKRKYKLVFARFDPDNFILENFDLSNDFNIKILPKKIDVIYHLSQSYYFRNFPHSAIEVFNVNSFSTLKLLDYALKIGCKKFAERCGFF